MEIEAVAVEDKNRAKYPPVHDQQSTKRVIIQDAGRRAIFFCGFPCPTSTHKKYPQVVQGARELGFDQSMAGRTPKSRGCFPGMKQGGETDAGAEVPSVGG